MLAGSELDDSFRFSLETREFSFGGGSISALGHPTAFPVNNGAP